MASFGIQSNQNDEMSHMLEDSAIRIFSDVFTRSLVQDTENGVWKSQIWSTIEDAGLTLAATSEVRGGPGAGSSAIYTLLKVAGGFPVLAPLSETFLAELILAKANLPPLTGPLTIGPVLRDESLKLIKENHIWQLEGVLHQIPWVKHSKSMIVIADYEGRPVTIVVQNPRIIDSNKNYAGEPRHTIDFLNTELLESSIGFQNSMTTEELFFHGALMRAVSLAGALEKILTLTIDYAKNRVQFGKPIAKFQAIQQQCSVLAGEVAASSAAVQAAIDSLELGNANFEIAAAKTRVGEAAEIVTAIAHQVHGAIGFTNEYTLQLFTRRAWSWRDEFGNEGEWATWIGKKVSQIHGEDLWKFLTSPSND